MPNGLTYDTYQAAVVIQIPTIVTDPNFVTMIPLSIDYAEGRILRDMDLTPAKGLITLGSASIGTAAYTVPPEVMVLESLYYGPNNQPVPFASQDYIRTVYAGATNGPPEYFAFTGAASGSPWTTGQQILLGPAPDATYALTGFGVERPAPLSATNTTTWISTWIPDVFFACAMIFWSGYMKNYGAAGTMDDPGQAGNWEGQYMRLLKSAETEEMRRRYMMKAAT